MYRNNKYFFFKKLYHVIVKYYPIVKTLIFINANINYKKLKTNK